MTHGSRKRISNTHFQGVLPQTGHGSLRVIFLDCVEMNGLEQLESMAEMKREKIIQYVNHRIAWKS